MTKQRPDGSKHQPGKPPLQPRKTASPPPQTGQQAGLNGRLAQQLRKVLGRHYAAKYPGRRAG